jgi:hypothetical protein
MGRDFERNPLDNRQLKRAVSRVFGYQQGETARFSVIWTAEFNDPIGIANNRYAFLLPASWPPGRRSH